MRRHLIFAVIVAAALATPRSVAMLRAVDSPDVPRTTLARMDAIAADVRGRLVPDLQAQDFEVLEDGTPRPIESVQFVRIDGSLPASAPPMAIASIADERSAAAEEGTRLFVILLDEFHVTPGPGVTAARAAVTAFISKQLGPADLALIVKPLDSLPNLRLTRDRAVLRDAVASFDGRKGDYEPRTAFERNFIALDPARIDAVRAQIVTSALNAIALHLGSLRGGRKTIVMVSEGFTPGPHRRSDAALPSLDAVIRSANRSNVSIYPIDPRAFVAAEPAVRNAPAAAPSIHALETLADPIDVLRQLAGETDGHAILTKSDVRPGLARIASDAAGYYMIAFQPAHSEDRGRFHAVDVRVKRPGITLRTRTGYWEPLPDVTIVVRHPESSLPMQRHASAFIRPWFGLTRADDGTTRVQFVWEPAPQVPGDRARTPVPVRVILKVLAPDGSPLFESAVAPARQPGGTPRASGDEAAAGPDTAVFNVAPGRVRTLLEIQDETARLIDTDIRDLTVTPMGGPIAIGTAQVLRARNAREFRELSSDANAVPVVTREFTRTERLLIRVPAYASGGSPVVTARLTNAMGQLMRELPVTAAAGSDASTVDLPLAGLPAAEYRIEIAATSGAATVRDSVAFRVRP
jgi:VWFA-related protein